MARSNANSKPKPDPNQAWYREGLTFKCEGSSCGDCCSGKWGPGYVWVGQEEMERLAAHLGMPFDLFTRTYVRQANGRYSLIEKSNHDCIFFDRNVGCTVYQARPYQCSSYPFWHEVLESRSAWKAEAKQCPGINCGEPCDLHSAERIEQLRHESRRRR